MICDILMIAILFIIPVAFMATVVCIVSNSDGVQEIVCASYWGRYADVPLANEVCTPILLPNVNGQQLSGSNDNKGCMFPGAW